MAFVNYNFSLFNRQSLFFVTLCYDFSAFCAFFDSLEGAVRKHSPFFAYYSPCFERFMCSSSDSLMVLTYPGIGISF